MTLSDKYQGIKDNAYNEAFFITKKRFRISFSSSTIYDEIISLRLNIGIHLNVYYL